ncbi:Uncharacterised protein r2_g2828 [Pycnogonum litorale]
MAQLPPEQLFELKKLELELQSKREEDERKAAREARAMVREAEREREIRQHELELKNLEHSSSTHSIVSTDGSSKDLPMMKDSDDIVDYLATVERLCVAYNWSVEVWATRMASRLTGRAREAYARMDIENVNDFSFVKDAILRKYRLTTEEYRARFRAMKRGQSSFEEHRISLQESLKRWTDSAKMSSKEDLFDLIIGEHLMINVGISLRQWILQKQPKDSKEMAYLCDIFRTSKILGENGTRGKYDLSSHSNFNSQAFGNGSRPICCYICNGEHLKRNCPKLEGEKGITLKCFHCSGNHLKRNCPELKDESNGQFRVGILHVQDKGASDSLLNEYYRSGLINGQPAELLRDSGCTLTIVHERFVNECDKLGQSVFVKWIDDTGMRIPLAKVTINGCGIRGVFTIGYVFNLNKDCYLGNDIVKCSAGAVTRAERPRRIEREKIEAKTFAREKPKVSRFYDNQVGSVDTPKHLAVIQIDGLSNSQSDSFNINEIQVRHQEFSQEDGKVSLESGEYIKRKGVLEECLKNVNSECFNRDVLARAQSIDKDILKWFQLSEREPSEGETAFFKANGLIFQQFYRKKKDSKYIQLVLPHKFRSNVLQLAHDHPLSGHFSVKKTQEHVLKGVTKIHRVRVEPIT